MTILVTVLLGAGVLFVASALDNTPIIQTFQKIISGQKIDWTGGSSSTPTPTTGNPAVVGGGPLINPNPDLTCPTGYTLVTVSGGKQMCQKN